MQATPNGRCSRNLPPGRIAARETRHSNPVLQLPGRVRIELVGSASLPKPEHQRQNGARGTSAPDLKWKAGPGIVFPLAPSPLLPSEASGGVRLPPGKRCVPPVHAHLNDHRWKCANPSLPSAPREPLVEVEIVERPAVVSAWSTVEVAALHQRPPIVRKAVVGGNILSTEKRAEQSSS